MNLQNSSHHKALLLVSILLSSMVEGFVIPPSKQSRSIVPSASATRTHTGKRNRSSLNVASDIERPPTFLDDHEENAYDEDEDDFTVTFLDDLKAEEAPQTGEPERKGLKRWQSLNPKIKQRLIEKGQARAIANKKKREPVADKKRRKCSRFA